jgi:hypothetical protein
MLETLCVQVSNAVCNIVGGFSAKPFLIIRKILLKELINDRAKNKKASR